MAVIRDESFFRLVEQNSSDLLWTTFGTEMAEFDGDHEAFGKLCDLVIGKSLEGLVLFFEKLSPYFFQFFCVLRVSIENNMLALCQGIWIQNPGKFCWWNPESH